VDTDQTPAISVKGITKKFKLYKDPVSGPLKELLFFWKRRDFYEEFTALDGISFDIPKGETIGVIGPNGAGKTTLLKLLAGLLPADIGSIDVDGKVTALLALGVGIHPEFSGRENIFYQGLLYGLSREEITEKTEEIIGFSELEKFIDRPFRTYSSGMKSRLLFSAAMSARPDILIIDEALATGDSYFVSKCAQKIREFSESGATIIFVSHNLRQVEEFCNECLLLDRGNVLFKGRSKEAIEQYIDLIHQQQAQAVKILNTTPKKSPPQPESALEVTNVSLQTVEGQEISATAIGEPITLTITLHSTGPAQPAKASLEIFSEKSAIPYAFCPPPANLCQVESGQDSSFVLTPGINHLEYTFDSLTIGDGRYRIDLSIFPGAHDYHFSYDTCLLYQKNIFHFHAYYPDKQFHNRGTMAELPLLSFNMKSGTDEDRHLRE